MKVGDETDAQPIEGSREAGDGQRFSRQQAAFAALNRTDWEIASQEITFAVNAVRAFDSVLYREAKLRLAEEFLRLNQRAAEQVKQLVDRGTLRPADLILARAEINDVYSHSSGDRVLVEIARILRAHCRAEDVPARFAGDEFTVFLRADLGAGRDAAERMRSAVAAADFSAMTPGTAVSISAGVAALRPGMTGRDLFQEADRRLYQAKRDGRDRVSA